MDPPAPADRAQADPEMAKAESRRQSDASVSSSAAAAAAGRGGIFRFRAVRDRVQRGERRKLLRQRFSYSAALRSADSQHSEVSGGSLPSKSSTSRGAYRWDKELAWIALWEAISNGKEVSAEDEAAVLACEKWRRKAQGERHDFWYRFTSHFQEARASWGRLTSAVRAGVPARLRGAVWYTCSGAATKRRADKLSYEDYMAAGQELRNDAVAVIDMDVPRTGLSEDRLTPLRNVLVAFAARSPTIGYCQSMNFVVAALLLYEPEERAFWMLCSLIEDLLPSGYYTSTMSGLRTDLKLLDSLIAQYLPAVHAHLARKGIDLSPIAMNWFLCLFVNTLPVEQSHRVLDCVLHEGSKVLFRAALGVLRARERELMAVDSVADVYLLLRAPFGAGANEDPWLQDAKLAPASTQDLLSIMYGAWLRGLSTELLRDLRKEHASTIQQEDVELAARRQMRAAAPTQELLARAVELIEQLPSREGGAPGDGGAGGAGAAVGPPGGGAGVAPGLDGLPREEPHAAASWLSHVTGDEVDEGSRESSEPSETSSRAEGLGGGTADGATA